MAIETVTRTHRASIRNQRQVRDGLDTLGFAASKLWNVARWTAGRVWDACGQIPDDSVLKAYLKNHERYADLNAQSSQRVFEELAEAFAGWYGHRGNGNQKANPPGYRKRNGEHPRSTVTFKQDGFKHDAKNGYIRLSKGRNTKAHWSDFILCAYDADPDVTIENVQQVRAVFEHGEWRLHIICRHDIEVEPPGDRTAGVDLGICNVAAVSFGDESLLYPGGALKEDEYYFAKKRAECDDSASREAHRLDRKRTERRTHFFHALSKEIVAKCVERRVGTLVVGNLGGIRDDENGEAQNWGKHGNLDLHGWAFDRFTSMLNYKAKPKALPSNPCQSGIRRRRVQSVVASMTASVSSVDCTCATTVDWSPTPTRTELRISDREVPPNPLTRWIGVTAGWHSQRFTCSTVMREISSRENKSRTANHNIPTTVGKLRC